MPELLRLKTPEFEFSIWANDISARAHVYRNTMVKRGDLSGSLPVIKFSPAQSVSVEYMLSAQEALIADAPVDALITDLSLQTPLFFENTQYQFEWVFYHSVENAYLSHRSHQVNEGFRFTPQSKLYPARLTGTINTGNDVGWMRLPLNCDRDGKTFTYHIAFEVLPTKVALHQDLPAMYGAIDDMFPLWRFSIVEKTEQNAAKGRQRGHFPLMWLANFAQLRARFNDGLKVICAAPHRRLQPTPINVKASKLKGRIANKLAEQVRQDLVCRQYDKRYLVEKKQLSVDTPENRFIKMAVTQSKRQLADFEQRLRKGNEVPDRQRLSDAFLNELHQWQQPLQKVLNQSFLNEVGAFSGLNRESLVLQQKTGYSLVYRVWQELKFYLDLFGGQSNVSMKSVAEIYEVWCFLCLKQLLENELGFELIGNSQAKLALNAFFEYQMTDGFAGAFEFKRSDGVTARLAHEPKFTKQGQPIRAYLVSQEPDIVLEVTLPPTESQQTERQFIWLFDAKYRIKTDKSRFDDDHIDGIDYVPDDAINQMHRYRDALIRLSSTEQKADAHVMDHHQKKSRPVFGAFALYPGFFDQAKEVNPYAEAIAEIGIGAFALLPSDAEQSALSGTPTCGHTWLLTFLQSQIGGKPDSTSAYQQSNIAEHLYVQEPARIPYHGMQQVLYPDLTLTVALGGQRGRDNGYFELFEQGTAQWYHIKQYAIQQMNDKCGFHVANEIRYLALAMTSNTNSATKQIDKIWPVKGVSLVPRYAITALQAGKVSDSTELYYLFELGRPLTLQNAITNVPHRPIVYSMKLTTLSCLENVATFSGIANVY